MLILSFLSGLCFAQQQVVVKGNAKSYAGDILKIHAYQEQISFKEKELAVCNVNADGDFQFIFNIPETMVSFIHLNVFKGILYIEPGKTYEIVLPQKVNKLPEDELNPFFEETEFFIRVLNGDDNELNEKIKNFNKQFDNYLSKYFHEFKGKLNKSIADSIIGALDKTFPDSVNRFFMDYKHYNFISLRLMAYERNLDKLIEIAFYNKPVLYQNPAYMDLFNQIFTNYLVHFTKTKEGKKIPYYLIKEKSLHNIKMALSESEFLKDDGLLDLIICKSLFDNFYKDDYPVESIIFMMDSIQISAKSKENRIIANNVYEKITSLLLNYPAPDFELPGDDGKLQTLGQLKGNFVYLSFINPKSYTCQQELGLLKKMAARNFEMLEIITICICANIDEMRSLIRDKSYNWKFLYYAKDMELLKKYNVKVFPTYYLINPEGKLTMSPAFPPTEASFEARYFDMLKAWKKELLNRKSQGIQR